MKIRWSAQNYACIVDVTELPDCMEHGAKRQEAIKNAEDGINIWIKTAKDDGWEFPQTRGRLVFA